MNSTEDRLKKSKLWITLYLVFIISFVVLVVLFTERVIVEPSQDMEDTNIFFPLGILFIIIVFSLAVILLYWGAEDRKHVLIKVKYIIFILLLICISGLSWSLRGVWGHQTGTLVWGTLLFSILMLENKRDHWILFLFLGNIGFAIGAALPFANYPFIPRLLLFATWGMLGCFTAAFGRYYFYRKRLESQEDLKEFHIKFSIMGFMGLALGITFASALNIDEGWVPGWLGGYVTGAFYGLILGIYLYYNNKKYIEETNSPEFNNLYQNVIEPKAGFWKLIKLSFYLTLFGYIPVAGIINSGNYNYNELGYTDFPFLLIIILSAIYIVFIVLLILKYFNKLGSLKYKNLELLILFLPTLWLSSISAILRRNTGESPDLITIILSYEFELSIMFFTLISTILFGLYLLMNKLIEKKK